METSNAARRLFARFIVTNLLILVLPFLVATVYYAMSLRIIRKNMDAVAAAQLSASVESVDRKLSDIKTLMDRLTVDYELNRFLNEDRTINDIVLYDSRRITEKLSSLVLGGEVMSHCLVYLTNSDVVIYESGYAAFESFYGTLFKADGYSGAEWKALMFSIKDDFTLLPGFAATVNGKSGPVHFLIRTIGYGQYRRGFIIGVIDQEELGRRLASLPSLYGGLVMAVDPSGRLLASSGEAAVVGRAAAALDAAVPGATAVELDSVKYLVYRLRSQVNDWTYIALAEERTLSADAIRTRSIAFSLLGVGALIGLVIAFLSAFTNSRPIARLLALIANSQTDNGGKNTGIYETVENAILRLADDNRQLASQVRDAAGIAHLYFFQTLLRGDYRDRARFADDRRKLAIALSECAYYIIVCQPSSLAAVLGEQERLQAADTLSRAAIRRTAADEHVAHLSPGEIVLVKRLTDAATHRDEVGVLVAYLRSQTDARFRGSLLFGVGRPVADPFLLPLSYGEASAALSKSAERPESLHFYADAPVASDAYHYPFDVEESLVRAVRAANGHLLESIFTVLKSANFVDRSLPPTEARNLIAALRGTVHRLIAETPEAAERLGERIGELDESEASLSPPERFATLEAIFRALVAELEKGKRSHNRQLGEAIGRYVVERYADHNLGLTAIADAFGISESYLSAFYKEQSGECLSERILRVRLSAAAERLRGSPEPVDLIGDRCGYGNATSFRRAFKRTYGMSPSEYRQKSGPKAEGA